MSETLSPQDRLWVALDFPIIEQAIPTIEEVGEDVGAFKVGTQLAAGRGWPEPLKMVHEAKGRPFADMKLNDIPNTMVETAKVAFEGNPAFVNIHTLSGVEGMTKVREAADSRGIKVLGVTVLTSISDEKDNNESFRMFRRNTPAQVVALGRMALEAGLLWSNLFSKRDTNN